jgi:hypothetical protein
MACKKGATPQTPIADSIKAQSTIQFNGAGSKLNIKQ